MEAETSLGSVRWAMFNTQAEPVRKGQAPENALWCELGQGLLRLGTSRVCGGSREREMIESECFHTGAGAHIKSPGEPGMVVCTCSLSAGGMEDRQISGVHWPVSYA